jgi:hypothetical protein
MTLVAIGSGAVGKPGKLSCSYTFAPGVNLWHKGKTECTNLAVPLLPETTEQISKADTAAGVQRQLLRLGYDAGPVGAVEGSKFRAAIEQAIEQAERSMGFPVTGEPTCGLEVTLRMQSTLKQN